VASIENMDANILRKIIQIMHENNTKEFNNLQRQNIKLSNELQFNNIYYNQDRIRFKQEITELKTECQRWSINTDHLLDEKESYLEITRILRKRLKYSLQGTNQWLEQVKFLSNELSKQEQNYCLLKENSDYVISILTQQLETKDAKSQKTIAELSETIESMKTQTTQTDLKTHEPNQNFKFNIHAKPFILSKKYLL
tara:strand:+ start:194 stop:784 length:591 start_codon:yes stop_codon:yes gene_type:complete